MTIIYIFVGKPYRKVVSQKLYHQSKCVFGFVPTSNFCSHLSYAHLKHRIIDSFFRAPRPLFTFFQSIKFNEGTFFLK